MARKLSAAKQRKKSEAIAAVRNILIVVVVLSFVGVFYFRTVLSHRALDNETLCPAKPDSITVMLVDVTDPMNLPQRQDFLNQLDRLTDQIPRHGKLVIAKVDPVSERLLDPVIVRCNPGSAKDVTEVDGNPQGLEKLRNEKFVAPLKLAYEQLMEASSADRSPILESLQSINLTELRKNEDLGGRRLIVVSDMLQNTSDISFYRKLPDSGELIRSQPFNRVRTDLRGTDVELWILQRPDSGRTQPRALPELWEKVIEEQGGRIVRVYTVSG